MSEYNQIKTPRNVPPWLRQLPNQLTIGRIAVIPVMLVLYPLDFFYLSWFCAILYAVAAATDVLDGFLARKHQIETKMGALLDPISDKLLVASGLLLIAHARNVAPLLAGLLIGRDIWISGVRLMALESRLTIPVSQIGKLKTFFENFGIFCLLTTSVELGSFPIRTVGTISLWIGLILALVSGYQYTKIFFEMTNQSDR